MEKLLIKNQLTVDSAFLAKWFGRHVTMGKTECEVTDENYERALLGFVGSSVAPRVEGFFKEMEPILALSGETRIQIKILIHPKQSVTLEVEAWGAEETVESDTTHA